MVELLETGRTRVLARLGVDFRAWYIDQHRFPTAARRFARDVAERRKPVPFLVQRGWSLLRADAALRARYLAAGFTPVPKAELHRRLSVNRPGPAPATPPMPGR